MSLHDAYARVTPFEVAFPDGPALEALAIAVEEEARRRGADETEPEAFMALDAAGERLRSLRAADAPLESAYPLASLLFHAVRFERAGRPVYLLATQAARRLARPGSAPGSPLALPVEPPALSGYLQLPQHLVWTEAAVTPPSGAGAPSGAPESVDGVFWSVSKQGLLHALPIAGLLPDRPGFGALPLPGAPLSDAGLWLEAPARPSGEDFASALPGAELDELYSVRAAGEVLKLLARFFVLPRDGDVRLEARRPEPAPEPTMRSEGEGGPAAAGPPAGAPRPSALPYTRVSLMG